MDVIDSRVYTLATPRNMEIAYSRNLGKPPIAVSLWTDEQYSARPGDYFDRALDDPLLDSTGEAMILVVARRVFTDALTDEEI